MRTVPWLLLLLAAAGCGSEPEGWTPEERTLIQSLSLRHLEVPSVRGNVHADDPAAAALGEELFFEERLSANGRISCASCHDPRRSFTDGRATSQGLGPLSRNAPSLIGAAWARWWFWDGRADSLWSQALGPLQHADEMGATPSMLATVIRRDYAAAYESVFGPLAGVPDLQVTVNIGKALEAHVRRLRPAPSRFDRYADALTTHGRVSGSLNQAEERGLRLFIGRAQCVRCHQGPLFNSHGFHNIGLPPLPGRTFDPGRMAAIPALLGSPFNCRGPHADAPVTCDHLDFLRSSGSELLGAFKVPSLRHVAATAPYFHDGRFDTLGKVLDHYNRAPAVRPPHGHTELFPLGLTAGELQDLEAFLIALGP